MAKALLAVWLVLSIALTVITVVHGNALGAAFAGAVVGINITRLVAGIDR